jgi:hypothetical protein
VTRRRRCGTTSVAVLALAVIPIGCGASVSPAQLIDGTPTQPPAVALETSGPQIATEVRIVDSTAARRSRIARCLAGGSERPAPGTIVERTGVNGSTVTFRTASGHDVVACDGTLRRFWCGRALGHLHDGHLFDPRLDLAGCATAAGDPLAFAWIEPGSPTRFVAVQQSGYAEVYETARRLPVRVTTTRDIDSETSSVRFEVTEHDAAGRRLRSYTLDARVAG